MNAKKMTVWTWGHRPFVLGGDVHYILKTKATVVRRFKCRGFGVACIEGPPTRFRCAETSTGAIVTSPYRSPDDACKAATSDIKTAKVADIKKQIAEAKYHVKSRSNVTKPEAEFWAMMPNGGAQ